MGERSPVFHQVSLVGEIDVANACVHGDLLCRVLDLGVGDTLLVDCQELAFLDLRGMAMMQRVHRHGIDRGTSVHWVGVSPAHRRLLALAGLERRLLVDDAPPDDAPPDDAPREVQDSAAPRLRLREAEETFLVVADLVEVAERGNFRRFRPPRGAGMLVSSEGRSGHLPCGRAPRAR